MGASDTKYASRTHSARTYLIKTKIYSLQVEPFDTNYAHELIARELGAPVTALFDSISPAPVAAASLGQAYIYIYIYICVCLYVYVYVCVCVRV